MFQFFFEYPFTVFSKGRLVLLGKWPGWILLLLIFACIASLAFLLRARISEAAPKLKTWRAGLVWGLQSLLIATLLLLLWQPAMIISELTSQQNIIAILVDDSRSMAIADSGIDGKSTREAAAIATLQGGVLGGLQKRFQTRIYRLDTTAQRASGLEEIKPTGEATHIGESLKQFAEKTSDLPIGAIVLLTDGSENSAGPGASGGIDLAAMNSLRNRHLPVHVIGFGAEKATHDVEMEDVSVASHAVVDSRMTATLSFQQRGYAGNKAEIFIRDGDKVLASREVTLAADGVLQVENVFFNPQDAGAKNLSFSITPLPGETNALNNTLTRPVTVSDTKRRILYIEGEPRWEYKFIRRAEDDDSTMQIVSMLRTTENKIYRQGIDNPDELADGFPTRAEDLFQYEGIIIGSVEADYFTPSQQELLREYVDRRGGGILFLGGRFALADGGWSAPSVADLLPTFLPASKTTFQREPATAELTAAGAESPIMRLMDDPAKNIERWKKLTYMMDHQDPGSPKPGATVLAEMNDGHRKMPLLITENYGRGRTAVLATSGTWRWQMSEPLGDKSHDIFWQQLLRWLVEDSPGNVVASASSQMLTDDGHISISASVLDKQYLPAPNSHVTAHFIGPNGISALVDMAPVANNPGTFDVDWNAEKTGSYLVEVEAQGGSASSEDSAAPGQQTEDMGHDVVTFQRSNGIAENFHTEQNRDLLEKLSLQTGGRYWKPQDLASLPSEISYSEAGISVRDTKELWDMPAVFLWLLLLLSAEWLLRRKWGIV